MYNKKNIQEQEQLLTLNKYSQTIFFYFFKITLREHRARNPFFSAIFAVRIKKHTFSKCNVLNMTKIMTKMLMLMIMIITLFYNKYTN